MKQPHLHSLLKALSWRLFASVITVIISYLITHQLSFAVSIGAIEFLSKIFFFYLHERMWERIAIK